jgi:hypothetical protein
VVELGYTQCKIVVVVDEEVFILLGVDTIAGISRVGMSAIGMVQPVRLK